MTKSLHPVDRLVEARSELYVAQGLHDAASTVIADTDDFPNRERLVALNIALTERLAAALAECNQAIASLDASLGIK